MNCTGRHCNELIQISHLEKENFSVQSDLNSMEIFSQRLRECPSDFIELWKGTIFRSIIFYSSFVLFQGKPTMGQDLYQGQPAWYERFPKTRNEHICHRRKSKFHQSIEFTQFSVYFVPKISEFFLFCYIYLIWFKCVCVLQMLPLALFLTTCIVAGSMHFIVFNAN